MSRTLSMVDCSTRLTPSSAAELKAHGVFAVARYLGDWAKSLTPDEVQAIKGAGLKLVAIWEGDPTYVGYFTEQQAQEDSKNALASAKALGIDSCAIYFTVDYNAQPSNYGNIITYFKTLKENLSGYALGAYGSADVLNALKTANVGVDHYWQTLAWSGGVVLDWADIYQAHNGQTMCDVEVDIDQLAVGAGVWPADGGGNMYPTEKVQLNGTPFTDGIVVNDTTYIMWKALVFFETPHNYKGNGVMTVNGTDVQGVINGPDTYLPWDCLAKGIQAEKIDGGWNFVVPQPAADTIKPPLDKATAQQIIDTIRQMAGI